jgi:protease I
VPVFDQLKGKRIAVLVANEGVEQVELTEPLEAVKAAGAEVDLLAPEAGEIQAFNHLDKGERFEVDRTVGEADAAEYDGLVLPGGVANPDLLRTDDGAVEFIRAFFAAGKPVGVICHGPWSLIEAGVVAGRTLTSWPSLRTDLRNAGAEWVDEEVHVDNGLVSSRNPDDLPAFKAKIVEEFAEGVHEGQRTVAAVSDAG